LFITLVAGILAGFIINGFERVLLEVAAVAVFIPLIMDMGGSVGTQSSTLFVRGVVLGHIDPKNFLRHFIKEVGVGLSIGLLAGVITGVIAVFIAVVGDGMDGMYNAVALGIAVGLALVCAVTLASLLGFLVPFVLIKLNVDQAAGAAPIITSIKDISGLIIYFLLVSAFLGHLLEY
jgi:magnesium transporter